MRTNEQMRNPALMMTVEIGASTLYLFVVYELAERC